MAYRFVSVFKKKKSNMKKSKLMVCRAGIVLLGLLAAVVFAVDTDTDGMSDGYELFFGLNHTNASDALLDTDGDSVTNLQESILWTDPLFADTDRDGWPDSIDANPLSRAVFLWSNPKFATGDSYFYTGPLWWNNAFRVGGDWSTNGWEAGNGLSNNIGSLNIQVFRSLLTNDAVLDVELFDSTNASLFAALCDSNQAVIVSDLYGNIVTGSQEVVTRRFAIPFSSYSNASILRLWRGTGDITVYSSLMYIDEDGDGVDADQELQAGTSDNDADSDDDGLNDFAELFLTDTNPLDADSDDDGYDDQAEVTAESDPNDDQSFPPYAVLFTLPFSETFEERSAGDLDGQNGWEVNDGGVAIVQSNTVFNGEQALSVTDASVSHEFTDAQTNVWISYRLKAVPGSEPQDLPADMAVVFYVNVDSFLCAYSNQTAITLPVTVSNDWNRFDIHSDFSSKHWNMRFNRELVVDNFPFYGSPDAFSILRVDGTGTYMDDVQVVFENPDRDNDGYTNDEETAGGSNPDDAGSIPVSEVTVSGTIIYEGVQTGTVHVIATTVSNGWNSAANDQLTELGMYSISSVPALSNVWIKAWLDSDGNGVCDPWDAKGLVENPLYLSFPKSGVNLMLSDPPDSDSDGLPDWRELELGTNPDEQDTDGDGLSDYTEVHSAYRVVWMTAKWNEAKLDAERRGGHLPVITSEQEHDDMVEALGEEPFNQSLLWIGASDEAEEEVWEWVTGEAFDYTRWANNAPNAGADSQDGLAYKKGSSHQWDDRSWRSGGYILEYENGLDPLNPDTDGDGVTDGDEILLGINPVGSDTDGDGVTDGNEISLGTDPFCTDSDEDGLTDGEEVAAGTDPLLVDTDGDGLSDKKELKDSRYQVVKKCLTWHEAKRDAELRGGHLATVTSEEEHQKILDTVSVQALRDYRPWVGATDEVEEGQWTWVTGEVFETTRWGGGRLDQTTGLQDWAYYLGTSWDDAEAKNPIPYLLEYELALDPLNPDTDGDGINDGDELTLGTSPHRVDSDGDGFSDQEEINLGMNPSLQSVVSPICLEGAARFAKLARISNVEQGISNVEVNRGAGDRWFFDMPLDENNEETAISVSFQNGAFERTVQAEWIPFNILQESQSNLMVRLGDSVKLTALPEGWNGGQFTLWLDGEEHRSPNCNPLVFAFDQPGTTVVDAEYRKGNQRIEKQFTVTVVDWGFSGQAPGCMLDRTREWTVDLPEGAVLEADDSIYMEILTSLPITNNQSQITVSLKANEVNGDHILVSRLYSGGPVLATTKLSPFWVQSGVDHVMRVVERYEDSELWETTTVAKHLPDGVEVLIDVFAGGVVLDDYTIERWLTRNDFEPNGEYIFRLFHPNNRDGSTCYRMEVHQNETQIGEIR